MKSSVSLEGLIEALRCLPGVGPKSAQRMPYHLLQRDQPGAKKLAVALGHALTRVRHCSLCNSFTEAELCELCSSERRDASLLCVVESPADLMMMEQTESYRGLYFVVMGRLLNYLQMKRPKNWKRIWQSEKKAIRSSGSPDRRSTHDAI